MITIIPEIKKSDWCTTLYVDKKPFLILGGEIHNSSSSSLGYMDEKVWPNIKGLNLNTIIAPVYWELTEPIENEFDFTLVEGLILQARREGIKLILMWFGSWKNALSTYVPAWVKTDTKRFIRAKDCNNRTSKVLSPFCKETVNADARAFAKLMGFIRDFDSKENTVIMMQVENEVGLLYTDRDYMMEAEKRFFADVPAEITEITGKNGNWQDVYSDNASECFMAYGFSSALNYIAAAGKKEYPLPMYVNAWTVQFENEPAGNHPSGGPNHLNMDIWKKIGNNLDVLAPDIYLPDFKGECSKFHRPDNPLLIPEARRDPATAANLFYAFGRHDALGYAPFGIEDLGVSNIDSSPVVVQEHYMGMDSTNAGYYLSKSYKALSGMIGLISKYRGTGRMTGFLYSGEKYEILELGGYRMHITYKPTIKQSPGGGGIIISPDDGEYIIAAMNCNIKILGKDGTTNDIDFLYIEEGEFVNEEWKQKRRLNGDEYYISFGTEPSVLKVASYNTIITQKVTK